MKITHSSKKKVQAAAFDAEAFRQRHKDAASRRAAKQSKHLPSDDEALEMIDQIQQADDHMEEAFDLLVPADGKADTVAGELVRAMMRILYRYYNDGDVFYEGYGIQSCADAVAYICAKLPEFTDKFEDIARRVLKDEYYKNEISEVAEDLINYISSHPSLITTENTEDMFDYDGQQFIEDYELEPLYEFDCDMPDSILDHLNAGNISIDDIEAEMEGWDYINAADLAISSDGQSLSIINLNKEAYDTLEDRLVNWLYDYGEELNDTYELPDDYDEEYEESDPSQRYGQGYTPEMLRAMRGE